MTFSNYDALERRLLAGKLSAIGILVGGILGAVFPPTGLERPAAIFGGALLGPLIAYPLFRVILGLSAWWRSRS